MKLTGVMPALVTPFDSNGKIDFNAFEKLLTKLRDDGVKGWVPCGSTGEYNAMTADERVSVLKFVAQFANSDELLIAGTNAGSTWEVIEHTKRARDIGYDTVLLSAPFYATPAPNELIAHYQSVLDAVDVDIILYNYPPKVGVEVGLDVLDAFVENSRVIGIKEIAATCCARSISVLATVTVTRFQTALTTRHSTSTFGAPTSGYAVRRTAWPRPALILSIRSRQATGWRRVTKCRSSTVPCRAWKVESLCRRSSMAASLLGTPVGLGRQPLLDLTDDEKTAFRQAMEPVLG